MTYYLIGHPNGGMYWYVNAPDTLQLPSHGNIEQYDTETDLEDRLANIQSKLPDHVSLPDEIGSS